MATDTPILITKESCPNCVAAKKKLAKEHIDVDVLNVSTDENAAQLAADSNILAAPALFADGKWYRSMHAILTYIREHKEGK